VGINTRYETSDETKQIIADWASSKFVSCEMPELWLIRQPEDYQQSLSLLKRVSNTKGWEETKAKNKLLAASSRLSGTIKKCSTDA